MVADRRCHGARALHSSAARHHRHRIAVERIGFVRTAFRQVVHRRRRFALA
jgi:hypothetical protein